MYRLNLDPIIKIFTGDDPFASVEDARNFIKNYDHYKKHGFGRWAVILKSNNAFIGWCGLKNHGDFIDLGFRLISDYRGKGYATEAAEACLNYGFHTLKMEEIVGRSMSENTNSIKVLEKLGMTYWKKDECNGLHNAVYYSINKNQYVLSRQNKSSA